MNYPNRAPAVRRLPIIATAGTIAWAALSHAATLTNYNPAGIDNGGSIDLTSAGTIGWAAWDLGNGVNNGTSSYGPTYTKAGGPANFSDITRISTTNGTGLRGPSSDNSTEVYTWTASDEAGSSGPPSDNRLSGVFSSTLETPGEGVRFSVTNLAPLSGGQSYLVTLYGYAYAAQARATASVGGHPHSSFH